MSHARTGRTSMPTASNKQNIAAPDGAPGRAQTAPMDPAAQRRILLYVGGLIVLMGIGSPAGGLVNLPISFFLKNKLHLKAHEVATFALISHIPIYLSFAFGFIRDRFNPLGRGDRGFLVLFGALGAAVYCTAAFVTPSYGMLLATVLLALTSYLFIASAQRGLTSVIGQRRLMSGRLSAAWNIFESLPAIAALLVGGLLSEQLEGRNAVQAGRTLFLAGSAVMAMIAVYGLWKPASVFDNVESVGAASRRVADDLRRLAGHWPIYPALLIWLLWNFSPGLQTPLQYYLQNILHAKDMQWGEWNAVCIAAFIPSFMAYGVLCQRLPLRTLLFWGTIVAVPQTIPLLFVHSVQGALVAAILIGLMGGAAYAAYLDLIIRACPEGLQGTVLMMSVGLAAIDARFGDVFGTALYERFGGFGACVTAITIVYLLILPVLLLIPKRLVSTADGEAPGP